MKKVLLIVMLALFAGSAYGQSLSVSGKVTYADDGSPVVGATVLVEESSTAVLTDIDGMYQITVPSSVSNKSIRVSFAGMLPQTKAVTSNGEVINFALEVDAVSAGNVVVTGYGSARKVGTVVGSVQQVTSKDLENRPTANVMDAMQGKVAGLQIYSSTGEPAQQSSIRLHGVGSLSAGSAPLYILDGIQVSQQTIMSMNPNDFESVSVLKDASSTSIYGSRAANGVIYYTTKRGARGDAKISVRAQYGVSTQATTTMYDNMMSTSQLWDFWAETGMYGQASFDAWTALGYDQIDTDWFRFFQKQWTPMYQGDVSISGGNEKTNYYVSGSIYNQDGATPRSYFERYTFNTKVESQVKDWMKLGSSVQLYYTDQSSNPYYSSNSAYGGLSYYLNPMYPTYDLNTGEEYTEFIPGLNMYNPNYLGDIMPRNNEYYGTTSSAFIQLEPVKNLLITSRAGLEFSYYKYTSLFYPVGPFVGDGTRIDQAAQTLNATITNTIEYSFDVAEDHDFTFLAGQEGISYTSKYFEASTDGIVNENLMHLQNGTQSTYDMESGDSQYAYLSFFGSLNYSWDDKLYFDATVRNDQSSKFSPENKSATFWAAGLMWNFTNSFLKDNDVITNLTAKVSYGTQGNSDIRDDNGYVNLYPWQGQYSQVTSYNDSPAYGVTTAYNPDLTWETQTKFTAAASISLWNKLNVDVEFYIRDTKDMLMTVPLPSTTGFSSVMQNVGGMRNTGIDVTIDYDILRGNDYFLNFTTNFNYNQQKITELFGGREHWTIANTGLTYVVGQAVSYYYPIFAGIDPATGKQTWYEAGSDFTENTTNTTTTEFNEEALTQNTGKTRFAPFAGGFNISGGWKGITLQADFNYVLGKWMINNDDFFYANPNIFDAENQSIAVTDYWRQPGDIVQYPDWSTGETMQFDTHLIQDASFLRLKNLTIGYDFPKKWFASQNVVSGFRAYFTGRNLLTITQYQGSDPEADSNIGFASIPNSKQFMFGIELVF